MNASYFMHSLLRVGALQDRPVLEARAIGSLDKVGRGHPFAYQCQYLTGDTLVNQGTLAETGSLTSGSAARLTVNGAASHWVRTRRTLVFYFLEERVIFQTAGTSPLHRSISRKD